MTGSIKYKHGIQLIFEEKEMNGYLYFHSCFNTVDINLGRMDKKILKSQFQKENFPLRATLDLYWV